MDIKDAPTSDAAPVNQRGGDEEPQCKRPKSENPGDDGEQQQHQQQRVILFYKYHPLSSDEQVMTKYQAALRDLCSSLDLTGRILVGVSDDGEGINGTLAGRYDDVKAFTVALLGKERFEGDGDARSESVPASRGEILEKFWNDCEEFARAASVPVLTMDSPDDFKWSAAGGREGGGGSSLFPDLNVKLVSEIIGTGGVMSSIKLEDTRRGYLTPEEWHREMEQLAKPAKSAAVDGEDGGKASETDTVLIDCRNAKEYAIGHFPNAIDPKTRTYNEFPSWVVNHADSLKGKKVLMYCTGGIRCEKASAFVRRETGAKEVCHLRGGIHKYLEQYGSSGFWSGKNFVFDGRVAAGADETKAGGEGGRADIIGDKESGDVVGSCLYCEAPHDTFLPGLVCTVCREPTLVCPECATSFKEYHCDQHWHLRNCYFTDLSHYKVDELRQQLSDLEASLEKIAVGKRYKQKRATLRKQCERVQAQINQLEVEAQGGCFPTPISQQKLCRNCGDPSCVSGECWGFHGLKRKEVLEKRKSDHASHATNSSALSSSRPSANERAGKVRQKERAIDEMNQLQLCRPPSVHRDSETGIRIPPPVVRILRTSCKGKWCGKKVLSVVQEEFSDLADESVVNEVLDKELLRVNNVPVSRRISESERIATSERLKNMDIISRIVHWHEPPVVVPDTIYVQKNALPSIVCEAFLPASTGATDDHFVWICDKPSTVPVHPAGPYLQNSLTCMLEGQESLSPRALLTCHRIDRVTSGLTLCCTNPSVARLIQGRMTVSGAVNKYYLARVKGKFPLDETACAAFIRTDAQSDTCSVSSANWKWISAKKCVEVSAPVELVDPINGIRAVSDSGKASCSQFQLLSYDEASGTSLIACSPLTGRGHQLRVHLQWLGVPIHNDVQYGGIADCTDKTGNLNLSDVAIQHMCDKSNADTTHSPIHASSVTAGEAANARAACRCCQNGTQGVLDSFTDAHLLKSGHSIDLHALRYSIRFDQKESKQAEERADPLAVVDFSVPWPSWAKAFGDVKTVSLT